MGNIAIITMVYNERVNLPIWMRHYTSHCPGASLFVVDHGSDDGSTSNLRGANVVPLPRTPFDDGARAEAMTDLQRALLKFYDVVIYTDCDEMLVADPRHHGSLAAFLEKNREDVIAPVGLTVRHLPAIDRPLDLSGPILGQRHHVEFAIGSCKPTIVRVPTRWAPGFHGCDKLPAHKLDLFLFHLNAMEIDLMLKRLKITSGMQWSERASVFGWSTHQRETNLDRRRAGLETRAQGLMGAHPESFDFSDDVSRLRASFRLHDGIWTGEGHKGRYSIVPEEFRHLI